MRWNAFVRFKLHTLDIKGGPLIHLLGKDANMLIFVVFVLVQEG